MSQKVKITGVKHVGASIYLGNDKYGNEMYSRNQERIVEWICDGWRYRFNEFRAVRPTRKYVGKDPEGNPIYKDTFLGRDDPVQPGLKSESKARSSWLRAMPSCAFELRNIEKTDWFSSLKRIKTSGGKASGFKKRRDGLSFTAYTSNGAGPFPGEGIVTVPEPHNGTTEWAGAFRTGAHQTALLQWAIEKTDVDLLSVSWLDVFNHMVTDTGPASPSDFGVVGMTANGPDRANRQLTL